MEQLSAGLHGGDAKGLESATPGRLLPPSHTSYSDATLKRLATMMEAPPDVPTDDPDKEESPFMPAGFTYLSQLVDHDLTFDTQSSLAAGGDSRPSNERSPRLDLDCLYGSGPSDRPFMYDSDGASLLDAGNDLPRAANGRAIIGDPRNDENSIVCQLQLALIKFHNAVVIDFKAAGLRGDALFAAARREVRWTYQRVLTDEFLPRLIHGDVLAKFLTDRKQRGGLGYKLFTEAKRGTIPLEFSAAAYRMGHSMVRAGYRLNPRFTAAIFDAIGTPQSLVGFGPLPANHEINWRLFFSDAAAEASGGATPPPGELARNTFSGADRLQFAYKLDTSLVNPLAHLPSQIVSMGDVHKSLGERNLLRGNLFRLATGQEFAAALGVAPLDPSQLSSRPNVVGLTKRNRIVDVDPNLATQTPLWFYILAEAEQAVRDAEKNNGGGLLSDAAMQKIGTQLGPVGGRIVAEVFYGLLDSDADSVVHAAASWTPVVAKFRMSELLKKAAVFN